MSPRSALSRPDPFLQDMVDIRRNFDDFFYRFLPSSWLGASPGASANYNSWMPPVETYLENNRYHVRVALPGIKAEDVQIHATGNDLTISGEHQQDFGSNQPELPPAGHQYLQRELVYGRLERVVPLPEGVDTAQIEAGFNNGILEITAPLSEKAMPRKIEVKSIGGPAAGAPRKIAA